MRLNILYMFALLVLISGCASSPKLQQESPDQHKTVAEPTKQVPIVLDHMDAQFLYLAAQQSLGNNQPVLAMRFFKALVKKDPEAAEPRLALVDLLLSSGHGKQIKEAQSFMDAMPEAAVASLEGEQLSRYELLYARSLMANDHAEKAMLLLEKLLQSHPENIQVRMLLVRLYAVNKDYTRAHVLLKEGLALHKDLPLQQMQVQLYLQQGFVKKADKRLAAMQKEYPEIENIVLQRSQLAEKQGSFVKAQALLQLFIDDHPDTALQSYEMLGGVFVRQDRLDEAVLVYQRLLPLTAGSADVLMTLGKLYYQQRDYGKAKEYFQQTVAQLTPQKETGLISNEQATALFYLGASLEASHHWQEAVPEYEKIGAKHSLYLDAQLRLVSIDLNQKKFFQAEERLKKLKASYGDELGVYEMLSSLRLQQERYQDVITESEKALDKGFSQALLFNRAIAFEHLKAFEKLDATLDVLLKVKPDDAEALNFYGYSLADRGVRLQDAQTMVEEALKVKPDDGYYLDSLAWVYFKQKAYNKALKTQLRAVDLIQGDAVMLEHLGDIYWQDKKPELARKSWQKAIELGHKQAEKVKLKIEHGLM